LEENTFFAVFLFTICKKRLNQYINRTLVSPDGIFRGSSSRKASNAGSKDRSQLIVVFLELSNIVSGSKVVGGGGVGE